MPRAMTLGVGSASWGMKHRTTGQRRAKQKALRLETSVEVRRQRKRLAAILGA